MPGCRDEHPLGHEHHHVGEEDKETALAREKFVESFRNYHDVALLSLDNRSLRSVNIYYDWLESENIVIH